MPVVDAADQLYLDALSKIALFPRDDIAIFAADGPDLERYLQGRITQDVKSLSAGHGADSLVLSPQGKIQGHFTILKKKENELSVIAEQSGADDATETFLKALLQFKVADQLNITLREEERMLSILGAEAEATLSKLGVSYPEATPFSHVSSEFEGENILCARISHGQFTRFDLVYPASLEQKLLSALQEHASHSTVEISAEAWNMTRISAGLPAVDSEVSEKTSATEIPYKALVSFSKGCYAGQEVVEMSIARGRPNKELVKLRSAGDVALKVGDTIVDAASGKDCGVVTSVCKLPPEGDFFALGFIKAKFIESDSYLVADKPIERQALA